MKKSSYLSVFFLLALMLVPAVSYCEMYQWTDKNGNLMITDDFFKVPEEFRQKQSTPSQDENVTESEKDNPWLIIPGVKAGPITSKTSEMDLIKIYGKQNVAEEKLCLDNECMESETGTVLFREDPLKKIEIYWKDVAKKRFPKSVVLTGFKSHWKLVDGISLGTPLSDLLKINDKEITFYGFGWDAGGSVTSWGNGNIEKKYPRLIRISLEVGPSRKLSEEERKDVEGDRVLNSSNKTVQKINPLVYTLGISFK